MTVCFSDCPVGRGGIVGHAGIGHVHSVGGLVQDDSAGFCVAAGLLQAAAGADLTIVRVDAGDGTFSVELAGGGVGQAYARSGISTAELRLARAVVGQNALFCQALAVEAFGRMYGQGADEVPAALEGAMALAVLDTLLRAQPRLQHAISRQNGQLDAFLGGVVDTGGGTVSVLAVVNLTEGGIGPAEDLEGNAGPGVKAQLLKDLGLDHLPTIIVESKSRRPDTPAGSASFLVRASEQNAAPLVAQALVQAGQELGFPLRCESSLPAEPGLLRRRTARAGQQIQALGRALEQAVTAGEKVRITAQLARFVREDCGGVTFMSDAVYDQVGGCGVLPGSGAVLSMLDGMTPPSDIPAMTHGDQIQYTTLCLKTIELLAAP